MRALRTRLAEQEGKRGQQGARERLDSVLAFVLHGGQLRPRGGIDRHGRRSTTHAGKKDDAEELLTPRWPPFPAYSGALAAARPRVARDGYPDHRSPRVLISPRSPNGARGGQDHLQDHQSGHHLYRDRDRRVGGGAGQHAVAGDRVLMVETGQFATLWKNMAEKLGLRPNSSTPTGVSVPTRPRSRITAQGQEQRDQGGLRAAQRDLDRLPVAGCGDPEGDRRRRPPGAVLRRHHLLACLDRLSPRRVGRRRHRRRRAEGPDAAARHVVQRGERQGARGREELDAHRSRSGPGTTCST